METYLLKPIDVKIDDLYPDANNPRLGVEDPPGYADPTGLFSAEVQKQIIEELGEAANGVEDLTSAIIGQGWLPIDTILVWKHPKHTGYVVVEGNRRRLALERIRTVELKKTTEKLARMKKSPASYPDSEIKSQESRLGRINQIIADTSELSVVPIAATTAEDLEEKIPRVLAVRHINGAKEWGNYAEDIWLLKRYEHLFADQHGSDADLFWDDVIIDKVAKEASLGPTKVRWQLKSASWFSHFRAEWEDELPEGTEFNKSDYFLFENIARKPWIRGQFGITDGALVIPKESETVLFDWVFKLPRGNSADDNPNVFYRHQNILLWDQFKRYDDQHGTAFAARFDVEDHANAPTMHEVESEWLSHKVRRKPHAVLDDLLRRLEELSADTLVNEGVNLKVQLERLEGIAGKYLKMIAAAES